MLEIDMLLKKPCTFGESTEPALEMTQWTLMLPRCTSIQVASIPFIDYTVAEYDQRFPNSAE